MTAPDRRRRRHELRAEADAHYARAEAIFERVEKRLEERRARRNRSLVRRMFGGRGTA